MDLSKEVYHYAECSVLCWLATCTTDLQPNVSPKEIFVVENDVIRIANIASPQSMRNIKANPLVCVSFIDVMVQKGMQIKGKAKIIFAGDEDFDLKSQSLVEMTKGKFPFNSIIEISPTSIKKIIAPSYLLYPQTTEEEQIAQAKLQYQL